MSIRSRSYSKKILSYIYWMFVSFTLFFTIIVVFWVLKEKLFYKNRNYYDSNNKKLLNKFSCNKSNN